MPEDPLDSLVVIAAAAVVGPLVAARVRRWLVVPAVVLELLLGVLIGQYGLGWASTDGGIDELSELGLAMLIFMAGYEIDFARVSGGPLRKAALSWFTSFALGLLIALALIGRGDGAWLIVGMALATTALGTILPIVRDAGVLPTRLGTRVLAVGAVGEFGPVIAIAALLTQDQPAHTIALLIAFAALGVAAAAVARRPLPPRLRHLLSATLGTSAQLAVRMAMLVILAALAVAHFFGLDILLGAFTSGIVVRLAMSSVDEHEREQVLSKLDAIAFGFLVPIYFVVSGMKFDLIGLLTDWRSVLLMIGFLLAFLVVRGLPVWVAFGDLQGRDRRSLALLAATALPLVVAITDIGQDEGLITASTAGALVGAGMVSVLVFPQLALRGRHSESGDLGARSGELTP